MQNLGTRKASLGGGGGQWYHLLEKSAWFLVKFISQGAITNLAKCLFMFIEKIIQRAKLVTTSQYWWVGIISTTEAKSVKWNEIKSYFFSA